MKVCVQGLWHLVSVTAACLASVGHDVVGLDGDLNNIKNLNQGNRRISINPGNNNLPSISISFSEVKVAIISSPLDSFIILYVVSFILILPY